MKTLSCDVLIVGAGVAGIAAARAAMADGASVLLIERDGFVGGLAAGAWVGTVCGAALCRVDTWQPILTGWPLQFVEKLGEVSGSAPVRSNEGLWFLPYH